MVVAEPVVCEPEGVFELVTETVEDAVVAELLGVFV